MGLRFRQSVRICKGVSINFGKTGTSLSLGTRGARYTIHSSGRRTATVGLPGSGLSYSESYNPKKQKKRQYSQAYYRRREIQQEKERLDRQKAAEIQLNALTVQDYQLYIEYITSVHRNCADPINWRAIASIPEPFSKGQIGPAEAVALKKYNSFKPSIFEKTLAQGGEKRKQQLYQQVLQAKEEDLSLYEKWQANNNLATDILNGEVDAYLYAIEYYNPFQDLVEYGGDFEFGTDASWFIEVEFRVKSDEIMPKIQLELSKTGKIINKQLSKTRYFDIMQDYVCGTAIRIAREIFAMLPVRVVLVHAVDDMVNTVTGYREQMTILSVQYERERFDRVNFQNIDASDFTETFLHNMNFRKTTGFKPVKRMEARE